MTDQIDTSSSSTVAVVAAPQLTSNGNERIRWPGGSAKKQYFSLPDNIIYYMIQNPPSPEGYLQLAMSCKYFFAKKPLLVVKRIHHDKLCSSKDWKACDKKNGKCCVKVDLAKLTSKIWLTHRYCFTDTPTINALLPQKLYKCERAFFELNFVGTSLKSFKLLACTFEKFRLCCADFFDNDGNIVKFEEILGSLPNVKLFDYWVKSYNPDATTSTMKNICKLDNLDNLQILYLRNISELFDIKDFVNLVMKHKDTKFWFGFRWDISVAYKAQLDGLCDAVIKPKIKCIIEYLGQDEKKLAFMRERYAK